MGRRGRSHTASPPNASTSAHSKTKPQAGSRTKSPRNRLSRNAAYTSTPGCFEANGKSRSSSPEAVPATSTTLPRKASSGTSPRTTSRNGYVENARRPSAGQLTSTSPVGLTGMSIGPTVIVSLPAPTSFAATPW